MTAENRPEKILLTEPITRPDGLVIKVIQKGEDVIIEAGPAEPKRYWTLDAYYTTNEVTRLGLGDFNFGIARLGNAAFTSNDKITGDERYFSEELKK